MSHRVTIRYCDGTARAIQVAPGQTVDVSEQQLVLRQWWYEHLGEKQSAEWIKQAAEALYEQ